MNYRRSCCFLFLAAWLTFLFPMRLFGAVPNLFEGELNTCNRINQAMAGGQSFESAFTGLIQSYSGEQNPGLLASIQRTLIHHAVLTCGHDPSVVVPAAYRAGLPLPLVVGAAEAAGVVRDEITSALVQAGLTRSEIQAAFVRAGGPPESTIGLFLPPAIEMAGLGPASPFRP